MAHSTTHLGFSVAEAKQALLMCRPFSTELCTVSAKSLQVLEQRTKFGAALSAPLLSLLLALFLSANGVLPVSSSAYDVIWTYAMPLGAALYLLESDLRQ